MKNKKTSPYGTYAIGKIKAPNGGEANPPKVTRKDGGDLRIKKG